MVGQIKKFIFQTTLIALTSSLAFGAPTWKKVTVTSGGSSSASKVKKVQRFTSGGTWTRPSAVTNIEVFVVGGGGYMGPNGASGGGGGGGSSSAGGTGGSGAAGYVEITWQE